jgi:SAM-dependent methyltransferase
VDKDEAHRKTAREIAQRYLARGDALGWFEALYSQADGDASVISWADLKANPNLVEWLDREAPRAQGQTALKIGCGLGDDAEELARRGFETTAFDISQTAISWCRRRYPNSSVSYLVADLFQAPTAWRGKFDFVLESYTLQVLPPSLRREAIEHIASFVAPHGTLLVIARGREMDDPEGAMPWPLTKEELTSFQSFGLKELCFEDYMDTETPPVRRFRVRYRRE